MSDGPVPYDHYRPTDTDADDDGVYRVVGVVGETVTLLEVGDSEGRRVTTGRVRRVPQEVLASEFTPATNPDRAFAPGQLVDWVVWNGRMAVDAVRRLVTWRR